VFFAFEEKKPLF